MSDILEDTIKKQETTRLEYLSEIKDRFWEIVNILEEWKKLKTSDSTENNIKIFQNKKVKVEVDTTPKKLGKRPMRRTNDVKLKKNKVAKKVKLPKVIKSKTEGLVNSSYVANFFSISMSFLWTLRKENKIPFIKVEGRYYYNLGKLKKLFKDR